MEKLTARTGWHWVKQGFGLFRRQPGALMALFFSCLFLSIVCLAIPLLGSLMPVLLAPLFSVALLQACAQIDHGQRALPNLVLIGFRKPARGPLLWLGALYLLLMLLALGVLSWLDDGVFIKMATRQIAMDPAGLENSRGAIFASSAIYLLGWLVSCLAAPLIYWQKMSLGKALFFSVLTVSRGIKAFLTGALILFMIYQVCSAVPVLMFNSLELEATSILVVFLLLMIVLHCTLYASYRQLFGQPPAIGVAPPPPAPSPD